MRSIMQTTKLCLALAATFFAASLEVFAQGCTPQLQPGHESGRNISCSVPFQYSGGDYAFRSNDTVTWDEFRTVTISAVALAIGCPQDPYVERLWANGSDATHTWRIYKSIVGYIHPSGTPIPLDFATTEGCWKQKPSPILINFGNGSVELTSAEEGVLFDIESSGFPLKLGWTQAYSNVGWLTRGVNVTNGAHLFGDQNEQALEIYSGEPRNGYRALRRPEFDSNGDMKISSADAIWPELFIWRDWNHNGIAESAEFVHIASLMNSLDLNYKTIGKKDENGNTLRFRSNVELADGSKNFSFDVFPAVGENPTQISITTVY